MNSKLAETEKNEEYEVVNSTGTTETVAVFVNQVDCIQEAIAVVVGDDSPNTTVASVSPDGYLSDSNGDIPYGLLPREQKGAVSLICPILKAIMDSPCRCPHCGVYMEETVLLDSIDRDNKCPLNGCYIGNDVEIKVDQELQVLCKAKHEQDYENAKASNDQPKTVLMIGLPGVGKSRTINLIAGKIVAESRQSPTAVTQLPSKVFDDIVLGEKLRLIDAPGLFDPYKSNEEVLKQIVALLNQEVSSIDSILIVMKLERIPASFGLMVCLLLDSLAHNDVERATVAKRIRFIITHCDSNPPDQIVDANSNNDRRFASSNDCESLKACNVKSTNEKLSPTERVFEIFRNQLIEEIPSILKKAGLGALFIEHDEYRRSLYNKPNKIRSDIISLIKSCVVPGEPPFMPRLISDIINQSNSDLMALMDLHFKGDWINSLSTDKIQVLLRFFQFIRDNGKWEEPRAMYYVHEDFQEKWNAMTPIGRDELAVKIACKACTILSSAAEKSLQKDFDRRVQLQDASWWAKVATKFIPPPAPVAAPAPAYVPVPGPQGRRGRRGCTIS